MCARYDLRIPVQKIIEQFHLQLDPTESFHPNHNVCPTQTVPIITNSEPDRLSFARWGLVPSWAKDIKIGTKMINARAETVAEKPSFRSALAKRRCLIPAAAFYEWRKDASGKTPLRFALKDGGIFAFAGLWELWKQPESGEWLRTCTMITTDANALVEQAHDRMPVILSREAEPLWLDVEHVGAGQSVSLLTPYPADQMQYAEVVPATLRTS